MGVSGKVLAFRPTQSEVEVGRILVGRNVAVAWQSKRNQSVVGELGKGAVADLAWMAAGAVTAIRIIEPGEPARLGCRQFDPAPQPAIVLAVVRVELVRILLEYFKCHQDGLESFLPA